jgi:hypothetical protein
MDITASWPLPLTANGFEKPLGRSASPQRSAGGGGRHPETRRTKIAQLLRPRHINDNDQTVNSYSHSAPLRYPCVSSFVWIMTPTELLACGIAPLLITPLEFPLQPSSQQLEWQAPPRSSDGGIY